METGKKEILHMHFSCVCLGLVPVGNMGVTEQMGSEKLFEEQEGVMQVSCEAVPGRKEGAQLCDILRSHQQECTN